MAGKHRLRGPPGNKGDNPRSERELGIGGQTASNYLNGPVVGPDEGSAERQRCLSDAPQPGAPGRQLAGKVTELLASAGARWALDEVFTKVKDLLAP